MRHSQKYQWFTGSRPRSMFSIESQANPIDAARISSGAPVANTNSQVRKTLFSDQADCVDGENLWVKIRVTDGAVMVCHSTHRSGCQPILLRHRANSCPEFRIRFPNKCRQMVSPSSTSNCCHNRFLGLVGSVGRHTVTEVLYNVQSLSKADDSKTGNVEAGIQQILPVRRRKHQVLMCLAWGQIKGHIFAGMIETQLAACG